MGNCLIRSQSNLASQFVSITPLIQRNTVVSLYDYPSSGMAEPGIHIGERLNIISDDGDFMMVKSPTTGCESYIPSSYTAKVTNKWLFTGISRSKAEELLMLPTNQTGAFLVRNSESDRGCYSLSLLTRASSSHQDAVKHYRIYQLQNGWFYISQRSTFPTLQHLIEHHSDSANGLCCRLQEPCFIQCGDQNTTAITMSAPKTIRRPTINWKNISRSMVFRSRAESEHTLLSEGLREAISSYLYMTEENEEDIDKGWDS